MRCVAGTTVCCVLQLAVRVREEARQGFSDASLLATTAGDLAANVSEARDTVTSLEGAVIGNTDTITMATETAQMATSDASRVQGEIDQLLVSRPWNVHFCHFCCVCVYVCVCVC